MEPSVDIITNDILIEALRDPEGIKEILRSRLPPAVLPAFLHEVTHHWCFLSPIGATITALRTRSDADLWCAETREDVVRAAHWRVASESLAEAYRPISEGLALFAQHHLRMEPGGLTVDPLVWTVAQFLDGPDLRSYLQASHQDIPDALYEEFSVRVNALLDDTRTAESQVKEISYIAQSRLDAAGAGYLPGLLLVKRSFNRIARVRPDLAAPTTFLLWAKEFLFHDTNLALDIAFGRGGDAFMRLRERLALFESDDAADLMERFAEQAQTTHRSALVGGWAPTLVNGLDVAPGGDEALRAWLAKIIRLEDDTGPTEPEVDGGANPDDLINLLTQHRNIVRDFFTLGSVPGNYKRLNSSSPLLKGVSENVHAAFAHTAIFEPDPSLGLQSMMFVPLTAPLPAASGAGKLDLLFWSSTDRMVIAGYMGKAPVTQNLMSNGLTSEAILMAETALDDRLIIDENIKKINDRAKELLDWAFEDFEGNMFRQLHDRANALLRERLFASIHGDIGATFERFSKRGFLPIFDREDRPTRLARLCAAASSGQRFERSELDNMLAWSTAQESILGFPLISAAGNLVQTAL